MRKWAEEDLQEAREIEWDVSIICTQADAMLGSAIERIIEGVRMKENGRPGCLQGQSADYLKTLQEVIQRKDAAFKSNREALQQKID